ncbi:ABC transporter ATP-binding protein [Eubacteriales bacterium OttesenSCG-928-N14]|nr:ABC transporter ATP-binding protein [Eubacteriales bacterium OttesenSCG-928-N14]
MKAIETRDLTKQFQDRTAVDALNLSVEAGEFFSLLGQNGAGKTTTIKMLCCLLSPTSGSAQLFGEDIVSNPQGVKQKINLSPQETAVAPNLTVRENLMMIAQLYGQDRQTAAEQAEQYMQLLGLADRAGDRAKKLSGGLMRRLSIAMALITQPQVLFLDEPTLGLDVRARRELWKLIGSLKNKVNVVLTTHYLEEAEALSDQIAVMHDGKLRAYGTPAELMAQTGTNTFEDAFLALTETEDIA